MRRGKMRAAVLAVFALTLMTGCAGRPSGKAPETVTGWETIPQVQEKMPKEDTGAVPEKESAESPEGAESMAPAEEAAEAETAVQAQEESTQAQNEESSAQETAAGSPLAFSGTLSDSALADALQKLIEENGLDSTNFSISYENLATGATLYCNELTIMTPASTYKLPLNMYYYDAEARGEMSEQDVIPGVGLILAECHYKSLVLSDNPSSEAMLANISFTDFRQYLTRYFTLSSSEIGETYWHRNFYCTRMMADIAAYLYRNADSYGDCISYLKQAMPGMYFRRYVTDCEIAQKYGKLNGWENCVGIVYGKRPFSLCVYTYGKSEELVARIAQTVYAFEEAQ